VGFAVAATFLPDKPYERFQLLDGTIYARGRWSYERMHFDPRPIDVAIVGDSRAALGISATRIEQQLAADGKPSQVANMSLVGAGRNQQWIFVQELLKTKRPKVIVLAIDDQPHPWGHDSFRFIAPASEVWREAFHGLHDTKKNLMYLPFRQLKLFAASLFPGPFGVREQFDPVPYAATPIDQTGVHRNRAGELVDMSQAEPRALLLQQEKEHAGEFGQKSKLPRAVRNVTDADDRVYVDLIAHAAAERGIKLLFVYQPAFNRPAPISNRRYYEALGPVQDNVDLAGNDAIFHDWGHVNTTGAIIVSDRIAAVLAKMLP
jgi:hypothetical protein